MPITKKFTIINLYSIKKLRKNHVIIVIFYLNLYKQLRILVIILSLNKIVINIKIILLINIKY